MRIPHVTHNDEADITDLEAFRKATDEAYKKQEVQVMMLAFLIKASVAALEQFPRVQRLARRRRPDSQELLQRRLLAGADVYLGPSGPGAVSAAAIRTMAPGAIIFAMANPTPEVMPEEVADDVAIMATRRSDYPNQINNVLAFPGIFRGALDVRASTINEEMKLAAARAIASVVTDDEIDPSTSSPASSTATWPAVAREVAAAAVASGVARRSHHEGEK